MGGGHEGRVSEAGIGLCPEQQTHFYLCLLQKHQGVSYIFCITDVFNDSSVSFMLYVFVDPVTCLHIFSYLAMCIY